jgi:hypothetical protein
MTQRTTPDIAFILRPPADPAQAVASSLGLLLKLDWVQSLRSLPAEAEEVQ